jgi:hypothetical protein
MKKLRAIFCKTDNFTGNCLVNPLPLAVTPFPYPFPK